MVVIGVLVVSILVGVYFSRQPPPWDEIGGEAPFEAELFGEMPSRFDDEAALRALVAEKRARRQAAADGATVASDRTRSAPAGNGDPGVPDGSAASSPATPPWTHLDPEVVDEARQLVARRKARLERTGKAVPDEHAELTRLLGPPHR